VLPGVYAIAVTVAGRQLTSSLRVEGDPRVAFSDADRRTRQTALMDLYELQKSLVMARAATAAGVAHFDAVNRNTRDPNKESADQFSQRQAEISAELNTAGTLLRAIEGYSGVPTADQGRQISWVFDDAARTVDALNRALQRDGAAPARPISIPARHQ